MYSHRLVRIRALNSWGFVLQSATQSEATFKPQHASSKSLVDTSIIFIFLFMEPNKSGLATIGVPGQGISATSCDKKILWKTVKDGLVAIDFGILIR